MKKILTLLFAVVTVAAFAAPKVQKAHKLQPQKSEAKIEMKAQKGDLYTGKASMMRDFTSGTDTMYMTPVGTFFSAFFPYSDSFFYSYNFALVPGNTELTWTNISTGIASDTYDWVYYNPGLDEEYLSIEEGVKDLVCTFPNYPGWWISPMLYADAYNQTDDENENYFTWGGALIMGGKAEQDVLGDGTTLTNMYQFSPRADYSDIMRTQFGAGYSEDTNDFFGDLPDGYKPDGAVNGKIQNFVQIFNYPGKPYNFSRIQLYAWCSAAQKDELTAKVCQIKDGMIMMDEPIAEATYVFPEAVLGEITAIDFYFEKEDPELGLTEEDWLEIDGDIAIVIEGVNDIEEVSPILNAMSRVADLAHDELYSQFCNGYAMWDFYDATGAVIETGYIPCHMGYYWGSGDDSGLPENLLLSINAQFAYIETVAESATEYTIPTTGGNFTLELKASEPYDAWAIDDIPEWITIEAEDEMEVDDEGYESYAGYTTLTITVEPNNTGELVYTLPGTSFTIKVGEVVEEPVYYLVGTFNEWSQADGMLEFVDNEGVLEATAELEAGAEFKVITPNGDGWTWYGGQDDNGVGYFLINDGLMNVPLSLVDGANFRLEKAGKYTFQLDPTAMTLTVVPEAAPVVPGDVDGDGYVTAADVTALYNWMLSGDDSALVNPDQDGDGNITAGDVTAVYNILLGQ
ncbi:MAG: hypothetical protein IKW83_02025 [Muribaculaceae bacterium]|nr:hypothetical protein [Muribaculaceae bacterium]